MNAVPWGVWPIFDLRHRVERFRRGAVLRGARGAAAEDLRREDDGDADEDDGADVPVSDVSIISEPGVAGGGEDYPDIPRTR